MGVTTKQFVAAYDDLKSEVCGACNGKKSSMMSFCRRCYYSLPPSVQRSLYRREGYAENYTAALAILKEKENEGKREVSN